MANNRPREFDEGPQTAFGKAFPTIKNIRVEVVQGNSFSWNPSEPRIYSQSNLGEYIECRERCQDGGFRVGALVNEMEKRREIDREITAYCQGREKRTQRRCKNRFSVDIHIEYLDVGPS
ncbi:MAG: hypothetical protein JO189_19795 [Deltaproteobacteria bacterium]|nr:hypothetical protein [Deltaproteobacteria bacterium]